jgi:hypothetical protein
MGNLRMNTKDTLRYFVREHRSAEVLECAVQAGPSGEDGPAERTSRGVWDGLHR